MTPHQNIRLLSWFNFFCMFIFYFPIAILYFSHVSGSLALGMSIFSITMITSALFEVPTGILSDRVGRKNTVVYGAVMNIIASFLYALGGSYWILVCGAVCSGISRSFFSGNNEALLYDTLLERGKEHEFEHWLGKTSSMELVGLAISSAIGGVIAFWSTSLTLWLSVIPQIVALIIATKFIEPKVHSKKSGNIYLHVKEAITQFRTNKKIQNMSAASILRFGLGESNFMFRAAFINLIWPVWAIGFSYILANVFAYLGLYFSGVIVKKLKILPTLITEIVVNRIINSLALIFPSVLSPILLTLTAFFWGVSDVGQRALLQKEFSSEQRATLGSLNSLLGSICYAISAPMLGLIGDTYGPTNALIFIQVLFLLILFFYWKFSQVEKAVQKEYTPA